MGGALTTLDFHGSNLFAVDRDGDVCAAIKPISEPKRLRRTPILAEGVAITTMPSVGGAQDPTATQQVAA